jgi:hypothetical protein
LGLTAEVPQNEMTDIFTGKIKINGQSFDVNIFFAINMSFGIIGLTYFQ